jgi:hypothetical protein
MPWKCTKEPISRKIENVSQSSLIWKTDFLTGVEVLETTRYFRRTQEGLMFAPAVFFRVAQEYLIE